MYSHLISLFLDIFIKPLFSPDQNRPVNRNPDTKTNHMHNPIVLGPVVSKAFSLNGG